LGDPNATGSIRAFSQIGLEGFVIDVKKIFLYLRAGARFPIDYP
jgi:hypothetical protein